MAEKSTRSQILFSSPFGSRAFPTAVHDFSSFAPAYGSDDNVALVQHHEYADLRESISTAPTTHHPSIGSEVSRFSFSTTASSQEDELLDSKHTGDAKDERIGPSSRGQSDDDSLAVSRSDSCFSNYDISEFYPAKRVRPESRKAENCNEIEHALSNSRAQAVNHGAPVFFRAQPAHPSLMRCRTQSEPVNGPSTYDTFPDTIPPSPPPSYASIVQEDTFVADGYFRPYKSKSPREDLPGSSWPKTQKFAAPFKNLNLLKSSKESRKSVPAVSGPQTLKDLHHVRALLLPYHQSIACYHAQRIEWYVKKSKANIWKSQNGSSFRNAPTGNWDIWRCQDAADPIPRSTFWDKAVSSRNELWLTTLNSSCSSRLETNNPTETVDERLTPQELTNPISAEHACQFLRQQAQKPCPEPNSLKDGVPPLRKMQPDPRLLLPF